MVFHEQVEKKNHKSGEVNSDGVTVLNVFVFFLFQENFSVSLWSPFADETVILFEFSTMLYFFHFSCIKSKDWKDTETLN